MMPKMCLCNCWFSHDVTKIQTKKLWILPRFYLHDAFKSSLKTIFHTNFRFKRVLAWFCGRVRLRFLSFCVTRHFNLHDGQENCYVGLKK